MENIILQNIIMPNENICDDEELYYRKIGIPTSNNVEMLPMNFVKNQRMNFDTYFNSLSLLKWNKYANVNNVYLNLKLQGKFKVRLIHYYIHNENRLEWNILNEYEVDAVSPQEYSFEYITNNPFGLLAFGLEAIDDDAQFFGGYYSTHVSNDMVRNVKIGLGICTYKREEYVRKNMKNLECAIWDDKSSNLNDKIEVFISDNAQSLSNDFNRKEIHLCPNKNTGGSGGFSRVMIEINKANQLGAGFTHILLMDDDIIFDPESIFRTYKMLSLLKDEYLESFVGGAMFFVDKKYIQHANGEYWNGERYNSFITTYNLNLDMRDLKNIVTNEFITDANYQAWWYCTIPLSICRLDNLSLPLFIKSDDIEYSIRNLKNLITLNGIAVWHESFESKYSVSNEYYTVRNYLISTSIHDVALSVSDVKKYARDSMLHLLSNFKYKELELYLKGIEDFLKGVDHLKELDPEINHKEIMKTSYKMINVDELELPFSEELYRETLATPYPKSKLKRLFRIITLNGLLLPSNKIVALGVWGGSHIQTFRAKYIIRYEPSTKKAFVLKRSISKFLKNIIYYLKVNKNISKNFIKVRDEFKMRYLELIDEDFWKTKL